MTDARSFADGSTTRPSFRSGHSSEFDPGPPLTVGRYPAELLDPPGCFPGVGPLFHRLALSLGPLGSCDRGRVERPDRSTARSQFASHTPERAPIRRTATCLAQRSLGCYASTRFPWHAWPGSRTPGTRACGRISTLNCFLSSIKWRYAQAFRTRLRRCGVPHPDAFFGASHAGHIDLVLLAQISASGGQFYDRRNRLAPRVGGTSADGSMIPSEWHDPLAKRRPRELELLLSPAVVDEFLSKGIRLGRIASLAV